MPVASVEVWRILYAVSRYLFPVLAAVTVFLVFLYMLTDSHARHDMVRSLPGSGTVGELVVLSGDRDLDTNTWFPVPREGVLGSVRSCDLVIPCPGVRPKHLDFSWRDGAGLLIRPRTGCEVLINGIPVDCRTNAAEIPLVHGSVLQVGSAVLRLHLFAALDNTAAPLQPVAAGGMSFPSTVSVPVQTVWDVPPAQNPSQSMAPEPAMDFSGFTASPESPAVPAEEKTPAVSPRRSDRWKEDFGE